MEGVMGIFSNGATVVLVVLLVLVIAYRYYAAFVAAKVLALDPARPMPALGEAPTNRWLVMARQFVALSGGGALIGPALAAQFGYLPGLLWILIGVCLAGAVQDLIVLGLSMRRNGQSLARLAWSEVGPGSGKAALIGTLLVVVIGLAALGKVLTKALGGTRIAYPAGTVFEALDRKPITRRGPYGTSYEYRLPAGTHVFYPVATAPFDVSSETVLSATAPRGNAVDIEVPTPLLMVPFGTTVKAETAVGTVFARQTEFRAPGYQPFKMRLEKNVYYYEIPVGTRVVPRDGSERVVKEPFEVSARAADLGPQRGQAQRQALDIPFGVAVSAEGGAGNQVVEMGTRIEATGSAIMALVATDNVYRYAIPAGAMIVKMDESRTRTRVGAAFTLVVRPVDIARMSVEGRRLVVPGGNKATSVQVKEEVPGTPWGTLALFLTVGIVLLVGFYAHGIRQGRVVEAAVIGAVLTLAAVYVGGWITSEESILAAYRPWFTLSETKIGLAMALFGLVAALLPTWVMGPRDYMAGFLKIGMVVLLVVGVMVAHPQMQAPAVNGAFLGGGPVISGAVFPFLFITILCGAVSGLQAVAAAEMAPRRIQKEGDARLVGYGTALMEGLVGVVALVAVATLPAGQYYNITMAREAIAPYMADVENLSQDAAAAKGTAMPELGEHVQGRTAGAAVALGVARVLNTAVANVIGNPDKPPAWLTELFRYWYHLVIVLVGLFVLTTVDTGTRVGRSLLQEALGQWISPKLGEAKRWPAVVLATAAIAGAWWYLLDSGEMGTLWSTFGVAGQALAVMALAIATAALVRNGKRKYVAVTMVPMVFLMVTTGVAAVWKIMECGKAVRGGMSDPALLVNTLVCGACLVVMLTCAGVVVMEARRACGGKRI
jgi:carbon starvation protein CstA